MGEASGYNLYYLRWKMKSGDSLYYVFGARETLVFMWMINSNVFITIGIWVNL